tara:strand:- start:2585 stop:3673 length:1089 start_codon:yes stop_codon:yes gene_type:complete
MSLKSDLDKYGSDGNLDSSELRELKRKYYNDKNHKAFAQELQILAQRRRGLKIEGKKKAFRPDDALKSLGYTEGGLDKWKEYGRRQEENYRKEAAKNSNQVETNWNYKDWLKSDQAKTVKEAIMRGEAVPDFQFTTATDSTDDMAVPTITATFSGAIPGTKKKKDGGGGFENSVVEEWKADPWEMKTLDTSEIDKKFSTDKLEARLEKAVANRLPSPKAPDINIEPASYKVPSFKSIMKEAKKNLKKEVAFNPDPMKVSMLPDRLIKERQQRSDKLNARAGSLGPVNNSGNKGSRKIKRFPGEFNKKPFGKNQSNEWRAPMKVKGPVGKDWGGKMNPKFDQMEYDSKGRWKAPHEISKEFKR